MHSRIRNGRRVLVYDQEGDAAALAPGEGFVYVLGRRRDRRFKIGYTMQRAFVRFGDARSESGEDIDLVHTQRCKNPHKVEAAAHRHRRPYEVAP
jgi:hypothetical protein